MDSGAAARLHTVDNLVDLLALRADAQDGKTVFSFLEDGEDIAETVTYSALAARARAVAAQLQACSAPGDRVLLLYPSCIDYMVAFFACLCAGVVAVPVFPPRGAKHKHNARLESIVRDSGARVALTTTRQLAQMQPAVTASEELGALRYLCSDTIAAADAGLWRPVPVDAATLAFLQYTSGSTGQPKGVMVSHGNLVHNERMIQHAFQSDERSDYVTWLPIYHDMGLIGNMLHAFWLGSTCTFMAPVAFLQRPARWLQAISRFGARISGGPNFAYEYCIEKISAEQRGALDLSSWRVAFNGAEPIRHSTLQRFAAAFQSCGFDSRANFPCYGMAETTLIVSGGSPAEEPVFLGVDKEALARGQAQAAAGDKAQVLVSSGRSLPGQEIRIVDPASRAASAAGAVGEIWIAGPHVAQGYWQKPELNREIFQARIEGGDAAGYLRTGDLGFADGDEIYITGRLKDVIIVRGANHYPQDIELTVESSDPAVNPAGVAAFGLHDGTTEKVVVVAEVARTSLRGLDPKLMQGRIRQQVLEQHEVSLADVVLIRPGTLPKTSSGKVQRGLCKALYRDGGLSLATAADLEPQDA